ncbi:MAG: hypothetical protein V1837_06130 [Candidatus Woesearchaeota archaeon]
MYETADKIKALLDRTKVTHNAVKCYLDKAREIEANERSKSDNTCNEVSSVDDVITSMEMNLNKLTDAIGKVKIAELKGFVYQVVKLYEQHKKDPTVVPYGPAVEAAKKQMEQLTLSKS